MSANRPTAPLLATLIPFLLSAGCATSSEGTARFGESWEAGPSVQVYPAGVIAGVEARSPLTESETLSFRAAYNATDRQDFGEHDDETGGGPGIGVAVRHHRSSDRLGWSIGGRLDLWFLEVDWEDDAPVAEGSTDVIVLQPTVEGGYAFDLGDGWSLDVTIGVGAEINLDQDGEDVGEGAIGLLGLTVMHAF